MDYDIFREELAIKYPGHGHALWEPRPLGYQAVQVGDVGYICKGAFFRLFNALLPEDHESHRGGVPPYHKPLEIRMSPPTHTRILPSNHLLSKRVSMLSDGHGIYATGPDALSFSCPTGRGAILSLPISAQRVDTVAMGEFAKYIVRHIDEWFVFARERAGISRREDIVLVTGCDLARSWANVAFQEEDRDVAFKAQVLGDSHVQWEFTPEGARGVAYNVGPCGENLPENQCIFIRGFRATRIARILPWLRGAAGPARIPGEGHDEDEDDTQATSIPSDTKYQDPLHTLLEYIATQAPDCDMALVHDDDILHIGGTEASLGCLQPDALMSHLRESAPEIWQVQCNHPPASHSNPGASNHKAEASPQIAASRVATFSKYAFVAPADNPTLDTAHTITTRRSPLSFLVGLGRLSRYLISLSQSLDADDDVPEGPRHNPCYNRVPVPNRIHHLISVISSALHKSAPVVRHGPMNIVTVGCIVTGFLTWIRRYNDDILSAVLFTFLLGRVAWSLWYKFERMYHRLNDVFGRIEALQQSIKSLESLPVVHPHVSLAAKPNIRPFPPREDSPQMESGKPNMTPVVKPLEPDVLVIPKDVRGSKTQTRETNVVSSQSDTKNNDSRALTVSANQDANHGVLPTISQVGGHLETWFYKRSIHYSENGTSTSHGQTQPGQDARQAGPQTREAPPESLVCDDSSIEAIAGRIYGEPEEKRIIGDCDTSANLLWSLYNEEAKRDHDDDEVQIRSLKDMGYVLIFAGSFSLALIMFIAYSKQSLKVSPADQMVCYHRQNVAILDQLSKQFVSIAPQVPIPSTPPLPPPSFKSLPPDIHINVFWIMALLFSLFATLLATFVRQWVCDYMNNFQRYSRYPLKSTRPRQYMPGGLEERHWLVIAGAVPRLLHVSLILFSLGLYDFALNINTAVGLSTAVPITISGLLYIFPTFTPFISPQSSYQCSFSGLIRYLFEKFGCCQFTDRRFNGASRPMSSDMAQGQMQLAMEEMQLAMEEMGGRAVRWLLEHCSPPASTDVPTPPSHGNPTILEPVKGPLSVPSATPWPNSVRQVVLEEISDKATSMSDVTGQVSPNLVDGASFASFEGWDDILEERGFEPEPVTLPVVNPTPVPLAPSGLDHDRVVQFEDMDNIAAASDALNASGSSQPRKPTNEGGCSSRSLPLLREIKQRLELATEGKIERIPHPDQPSISLSITRWATRLLMSAASLVPSAFPPYSGFLDPVKSTPYYPAGDLSGHTRDIAFSTAMDCIDDLEAYIPGGDDVRIANKFVALAQALSDLGLHNYALTTSGFALDALQRPYTAEPNNARLHVASVLSLRAIILCDLKKNDEAIDAGERAVTLCRVHKYSQTAPVLELTYAMLTHAVILYAIGLKEGSAAVAFELLSELDESRPETKGVLALGKLCVSTSRIGADNSMAVSMADETIDSIRMSLDANSQTVLAGALIAKSKALSSQRQNDAASTVSAAAVTLLRSMSVARPVFSLFLAHALDTHAHHLSEADRKGDSYSVRQDAVECWQALKATAGGAVARPLAWSLFELAKFHRKGANRQARYEELKIAESAVEMFREVEPLDAPGLGDALYFYADRMLELGRNQEAATYAEESISYFREAAWEDPKYYALDLIFSLSLASACLACTERDDAAFEYAKQAVEVQHGRGCAGEPQYDAHLRKLLMDVVFRATEMGRVDDAAPWYEELQSLGGSDGLSVRQSGSQGKDGRSIDKLRDRCNYGRSEVKQRIDHVITGDWQSHATCRQMERERIYTRCNTYACRNIGSLERCLEPGPTGMAC